MKKLSPQLIAMCRMMLIPLLSAIGGYSLGSYPAEVTAFCSAFN